MPVIASVALGAAGIGSGIMGANKQAKAADRAAKSQMELSQQILGESRQARQTAMDFARQTETESMLIDKQLQNINQGMELIQKINPTIAAAAQQSLNLMQGGEAGALGGLRNEQARQRQQLVETLRQRLGGGAETSSAGIEALSRFDQQTQLANAQVQHQTLGQLLQATLAGRPNVEGATSSLLGQVGGIQQRMAGASLGDLSAYNPMISALQQQGIAGMIPGQQMGAMGQSLSSLGGLLGASEIMKGDVK